MPAQPNASQFAWLLPVAMRLDGRAQGALSALRLPASSEDAQDLVALNVRRMLKVMYPETRFRVQAMNFAPHQQSHLRIIFAEFEDAPLRADVEQALKLWSKVAPLIASPPSADGSAQGRAQFQALMGAVYLLEVSSHPVQAWDVEKRRQDRVKKASAHLKASLPTITSAPAKPRM